jgi:hypothetical protein
MNKVFYIVLFIFIVLVFSVSVVYLIKSSTTTTFFKSASLYTNLYSKARRYSVYSNGYFRRGLRSRWD